MERNTRAGAGGSRPAHIDAGENARHMIGARSAVRLVAVHHRVINLQLLESVRDRPDFFRHTFRPVTNELGN